MNIHAFANSNKKKFVILSLLINWVIKKGVSSLNEGGTNALGG